MPLLVAVELHLNTLRPINKHKNSLKLVAVCDMNSERVIKMAHENNCIAFNSLSALLKERNAMLIIFCTPGGLHTNQTSLCAAASKHVMTEKPMATRWQEGLKMVKNCDNTGVELFVDN